jgi:hypothetical protein
LIIVVLSFHLVCNVTVDVFDDVSAVVAKGEAALEVK